MAFAVLSVVCVLSVSTLAPASAAHSGSIVWLQDDTTLAVANLDSNTITLVGTDPFVKLDEITVGRHPRSLAAGHDGRWLFVSLAETDRVVRVDLSRRRRAGSLRVPGGPFAMVAHPQAAKLYVAAAYADIVVEIDIASGQIARQLSVAAAPRGMSISPDGQRLFVVHFYSGALTIIDTAAFNVIGTIINRPDANLARSVAITPDGLAAYLPHIRSNVTNRRLQFDTTVFPVVSRLDLVEQMPDHTGLITLDAIGRPANNPWDAVVSHDGRRLYVVNSGSNDVHVLDLQSGRCLAQTDVGTNPRGIVLSADGRRAYVHNALSNDVSRVGTASLTELRRLKLTRDRLPETIQRGKVLFHSTRSRSMTLDRWISCASCHPDGESDGRTWQFAAGPRKTPSLHGASLTLPHNRSADRDELQDTERFIRHLMGGTGLLPGSEPPEKLGPSSAGRSEDADALAAYIASLQPRRSPFASGTAQRRGAIARGRKIFFSQRTSCARCHPPPLYTDSRLSPKPWKTHDVGTGQGPKERAGPNYDTPSLLGLFAARSYLHDGRARTLDEVFTIHNANDRHGATSHLNDAQIGDLVAYLLSLPDGREKVTRN